ncbi:MAG: type VI secretion system-associated FHA domain protein TagH [Pseudomonadales bacterium]|nr:type VI secretion system-associated FHA domain protein TagH [Pseudomonadales bacterium]
MKLILEVTSEERHLLGENARKCFQSVGGVIGRGSSCDWVIPDQKRHLSGEHAVISCEEGTYNITDVSTNGVFINGSEQALGRNVTVVLNEADRLSMGNIDFVVRLQLAAEDHPFRSQPAGFSQTQASDPGYSVTKQIDPVALFKSNHGLSEGAAPLQPTPGIRGNMGAVKNSSFSLAEQVVSAPDHLPSVNTAFVPPKMLPEDWLDEPGAQVKTYETQKRHQEAPSAISQKTHIVPNNNVSTPIREENSKQSIERQQIDRFFKGLGVSPKILEKVDGLQAMEDLGACLRANFEGMVALMQQRAELKNEFRMDMTLVKTEGNNPLKFSADSKQAMKHLFQQEKSSFLNMDEAFSECFRDMQLHQVALLTGAQEALREMFKALSPDAIVSKVEGDRSGITMASKTARCWSRYQTLHRELAQEDDLFDKVFGSAFVNAYENHIQQLKTTEEV